MRNEVGLDLSVILRVVRCGWLVDISYKQKEQVLPMDWMWAWEIENSPGELSGV